VPLLPNTQRQTELNSTELFSWVSRVALNRWRLAMIRDDSATKLAVVAASLQSRHTLVNRSINATSVIEWKPATVVAAHRRFNAQRKTELNSTERFSSVQFSSVQFWFWFWCVISLIHSPPRGVSSSVQFSSVQFLAYSVIALKCILKQNSMAIEVTWHTLNFENSTCGTAAILQIVKSP